MPGATKDGICITIDDARRTLTVEVKTAKDESKDEVDRAGRIVHVTESYEGTVSRNVILPTNVKLDAIKSSVEKGQLCVTVPKANASAAPRAIAVGGCDNCNTATGAGVPAASAVVPPAAKPAHA